MQPNRYSYSLETAGHTGFKKYLRDRYLSDPDAADASRRQSSSSSSTSPPLSPPVSISGVYSTGSRSAPPTPLQLLLMQQQIPLRIECRFVFPPLADSQQSAGDVSSSNSSHGNSNNNNNNSSSISSNTQYVCSICARSFTRGDMLNRHARLHSGRRPYGCPVCGLAFSRSDHLTTHQRTHTGEKPYACQHCSYSACRKDMINRHMKVHAVSPAQPAVSKASLSTVQ